MDSVETDIGNDEVVVTGVVDPAKLADDVYKKTRKQVSIVIKEEEKKQEEKKEESKDGGGGEKKHEESEQGKGSSDDDKSFDIKRSEYWPSKYYSDYAYTPQIFSDENPNACSVMWLGREQVLISCNINFAYICMSN